MLLLENSKKTVSRGVPHDSASPQLTLPISGTLQSVRLWLHSAQLKTAHPELCATKNSAASALLVRLLRFVDVHVLGVNDFAGRRGARPGLRPARRSRNSVGGACRASLRSARLRGLVEGFRQGVGGSFELLRRRRDLVEDASGKSRLCRRQCFFHRLDIGFGKLLAVFGDQLLDLIHPAVENVPRLDLR